MQIPLDEPWAKAEPLPGGFTSYTYGQLWEQLRSRLGHHLAHGDPKWVAYLLDFMETTTNLTGENPGLQKTDQFFIDHHAQLELLVTERKAFLARFHQKVPMLRDLMTGTQVAAKLTKEPWIYRESCLVLDFRFHEGQQIAFDVYLLPTGWELQLFGRTAKSKGFLDKLIRRPALKALVRNTPLVDGRYDVQEWSVETELTELQKSLCDWAEALLKVAGEPIK